MKIELTVPQAALVKRLLRNHIKNGGDCIPIAKRVIHKIEAHDIIPIPVTEYAKSLKKNSRAV